MTPKTGDKMADTDDRRPDERKQGRDFRPLSKSGKAELRDQLAKALTEHERSEAELLKTKDRVGRRFTARFWIAVVFLLSGIILIATVFLGLPLVTSQFQAIQKSVFDDQQRQSLEDVKSRLSGPEFTQLINQTKSLESSFKSLQISLTKVEEFTKSLEQIQGVGELASKNLRAQTEPLVDIQSHLSAAVQKLNGLSVATPASSPTTQAATRSTVFEPGLARFEAVIAKMAEDKDIAEARKLIEDEIPALDRYSNDSFSQAKEIWNRTRPYSNNYWREFPEPKDLIALDALFNRSPATQPTSLPRIRSYLTMLSQQNTIKADEGLKSSMNDFVLIARGLNENFSKLNNATARVATARDDLERIAKDLQGNAILTSLSRDSSAVFSTVSNAADVIEKSRSTFESTGNSLKSLESATENLDRLSELQRDLAFKGTSPAALLLLAIAGMFVTLGVRALLKWVQDIDQRRIDSIWRIRTKLYCVVATELLAQGYDPNTLLRRLQSTSQLAEGESSIKSPITETLSELLPAIKQRLR